MNNPALSDDTDTDECFNVGSFIGGRVEVLGPNNLEVCALYTVLTMINEADRKYEKHGETSQRISIGGIVFALMPDDAPACMKAISRSHQLVSSAEDLVTETYKSLRGGLIIEAVDLFNSLSDAHKSVAREALTEDMNRLEERLSTLTNEDGELLDEANERVARRIAQLASSFKTFLHLESENFAGLDDLRAAVEKAKSRAAERIAAIEEAA